MYIDAYTYWQTMGTLNELEIDLARLFYKNEYNELLLGPIEKQPKIQQLFGLKTQGNDPIKKDLKSADVLKYLDQYMTKNSVWKSENDIDVKDFFQFIAKEVSVKNISQLGIRMKSVYFARNVCPMSERLFAFRERSKFFFVLVDQSNASKSTKDNGNSTE